MTHLLPPLTAIFSKTDIGQQEIQTRSLSLPPLVRRLLVLVDGRRSGADLAAFVPDGEISNLLGELLARGCVEAPATDPALAVTVPTPLEAPEQPEPLRLSKIDRALASLPAASTRSANDVEMARNFMTNSVNAMFGQNTRLSLLESIFACKTAEAIRGVYPAWVETMSASRMGALRLPEMREKLFKVL